MKIFFLIFLLISLYSCRKEAEIQTVTGKIIDKATGLPAAGVRVILYDTYKEKTKKDDDAPFQTSMIKYVTTGADGNYSMTYQKASDRSMESFSITIAFAGSGYCSSDDNTPPKTPLVEMNTVVNFYVSKMSYVRFKLTKTSSQPNYISEYGVLDSVSMNIGWWVNKSFNIPCNTVLYSDSIMDNIIPIRGDQTAKAYIKIRDNLNQETTFPAAEQFVAGGDTAIFQISY